MPSYGLVSGKFLEGSWIKPIRGNWNEETQNLSCRVVAAVLLFSVTGCSGDTTWVFETEKGTVPAGVYISYLQDAYTDAQNELGSTENIWDQTIDVFRLSNGLLTEQ